MGVGKEKNHRIPSNRLYRVYKRVQWFFVFKIQLWTHFESERITAKMIVWKTNIIFTLEMHSVSVSFRSKFSRERILNTFIDEWNHIVYTLASGANCKHIKPVRYQELRLVYQSERVRDQTTRVVNITKNPNEITFRPNGGVWLYVSVNTTNTRLPRVVVVIVVVVLLSVVVVVVRRRRCLVSMWKPGPAATGAHSSIMYSDVSVRARAHARFGNVAYGASLDTTHAHAQRRAWIVRSVGELRCRAAAVVVVMVRGRRGPGCFWCSGSEPPTEPTERLCFVFLDGFSVDFSSFQHFVMGTSSFFNIPSTSQYFSCSMAGQSFVAWLERGGVVRQYPRLTILRGCIRKFKTIIIYSTTQIWNYSVPRTCP